MGTQLTEEPDIRFCINAFTEVNGVQEYADPIPDDKDLQWTVYTRTPDGGSPEGDFPWEGDYPTYDAARKAAEEGCAALSLNPEDIRLY